MPRRSKIDRVRRSYPEGLSDPVACLAEAHVTRYSTDPGTGLSQRATHAPHRKGVTNIAAGRNPVALRARDGGRLGLSLDRQHGYRVIRSLGDTDEPVSSRRPSSWRIGPSFCEYGVLGRPDTELLVFHHHPGSTHLGPDHPHLHVSAELIDRAPNGDATPYELDRRHAVTGMVTLAAVVRMLIEEFVAEWPGNQQRTLAAADAQPP